MPKGNLVGPTQIIVGAWKNLIHHPRLYTEFTAWIVGISVMLWAAGLIIRQVVPDQAIAQSIYGIVRLPAWLIMVVVLAAVIDATAKTLRGRQRVLLNESLNVGVHKLVSFIWISFLTSCIVLIGPILAGLVIYLALRFAQGGWSDFVSYGLLLPFGGLLLTAPPALYIIRLIFAPQFLIVDGIRGRMALTQSRLLVAGRWWRVLIRLAIPALLYYLASRQLIALIYLFVGSVLGDPGMFFGAVQDINSLPVSHTLFSTIVPRAVYGFSVPLYVASNLILWNDLKKH